jgi:hypothetical protein
MLFLLKLLLVPFPIALVTLAGRRWGPAIAALLVQLAMKWLMGAPQRASRANAA